MVAFPNCKINLGLTVTGKRADGFHDIETVFYPLPLRDVLEIVRSQRQELHISGVEVPGEQSSNLCVRAYELLKRDYPQISPVQMFLHKAIPIGGGLGGGSSDGAFTLKLLNKEFRLQIQEEKLLAYALQLGSDCPFFIANKPCLATGRGELMKEIELSLDEYYFALVDSGVHVNTGWAFGRLKNMGDGRPLAEIISLPIESWKDNLVNDFEAPVFEEHPKIKSIKDELYRAGAIYASMTGTGGCVYGIFNRKAGTLPLGKEYRVYYINKNH